MDPIFSWGTLLQLLQGAFELVQRKGCFFFFFFRLELGSNRVVGCFRVFPEDLGAADGGVDSNRCIDLLFDGKVLLVVLDKGDPRGRDCLLRPSMLLMVFQTFVSGVEGESSLTKFLQEAAFSILVVSLRSLLAALHSLMAVWLSLFLWRSLCAALYLRLAFVQFVVHQGLEILPDEEGVVSLAAFITFSVKSLQSFSSDCSGQLSENSFSQAVRKVLAKVQLLAGLSLLFFVVGGQMDGKVVRPNAVQRLPAENIGFAGIRHGHVS